MNPLTYVKLDIFYSSAVRREYTFVIQISFYRYVITHFPKFCHSAGNTQRRYQYSRNHSQGLHTAHRMQHQENKDIFATIQEENQKKILICVSNKHISRNMKLSYRL